MGIAYCFYQLGNYKKAFKAIDRALQLDPACEEALAMKASLLRSSPDLSPQDRVVASLQVIKQLYAVNPKHPEALNYIADHHFWSWVTPAGLHARAIHGSDHVTLSGESSELFHPAQAVRINGVTYRLKSSRDAVDEHTLLLATPFAGEDTEKAEIQVRDTASCLAYALESAKVAKVSSLRSEALELAGRCYHVNDNWAKAREMYEKAIRANKKNILAQYEMIQMWEFSGRVT